MSQPGRRSGRGGANPAVSRKLPASGVSTTAAAISSSTHEDTTTASERATPASKADSDPKDDSSSNGDRKEADGSSAAKPPSAGASIRETANKVMALAVKSEWTPCEQELKKLEKYVANAGEDANLLPLAGILDPVSNDIVEYHNLSPPCISKYLNRKEYVCLFVNRQCCLLQ